jgi:hypothetical protein
MKTIIRGLSFGISIIILLTYCSKNKPDKSDIITKINQLPELKIAEARVDSLKAAGLEVEIQIVIVKDSFYPEDSLKNLSLALIEEDYGFDQITLYEIKFNKTTDEIISIQPSKIK